MKKADRILHTAAGTLNDVRKTTIRVARTIGGLPKKIVKTYADRIENVEKQKVMRNMKMKNDLESGEYLR